MGKSKTYRLIVLNSGFTVVEVVVALMILALICSSVLMIIKQDMVQLGESQLRMQAFEVARENMENLLTATSVSQMNDYGTSDKNPNIEWETIVESFNAEGSNKMWVRAVCSATYPDANGQPQKVELTHWLTDVPESVAEQMRKDAEKDMNEPNMPGDANGINAIQQPGSGTDNQNIDPILQKAIDDLRNRQ